MTVEVCLGVQRVAQPVPHRNPGGDCFACAATAGLRWLYPERDVQLDDVWDKFVVEYHDGKAQENLVKLRDAVGLFVNRDMAQGIAEHELEAVYREVCADKPKTTVGNHWTGFKDVLEKVSREWGRLEVTWDMVEPHFDRNGGTPHWSYPWRWTDCGLEYARRLEGWLRGGWVAFTEVKLGGGGPFTVDDAGKVWMTGIDHFVVIDGVRHAYVETRNPDGSFHHGSWTDEIHVVDSSTRNITGWHRTLEFTRSHGASSWWLARRDQRK